MVSDWCRGNNGTIELEMPVTGKGQLSKYSRSFSGPEGEKHFGVHTYFTYKTIKPLTAPVDLH